MINQLLQALGIKSPVQTSKNDNPRQVAPMNRTGRGANIAPVRHRPGCSQTGTDLIALVGFHDKAFVISLPAEPWGEKLTQRVAELPARRGGAGTNIASALRLALELTKKCPPGTRKRIWLLSDGDANTDTADTEPAAQAICDAKINLNVIAFGEAANSSLLKKLAAKTHHGRFIPVTDLHQMAAALKRGSHNGQAKRQHRQEVAILCVDCSVSMGSNDMGDGKTRIEAVRDAIQSLLIYKAAVWS